MIELKLKNSVREKALPNLLKEQTEIWQNEKIYFAPIMEHQKKTI